MARIGPVLVLAAAVLAGEPVDLQTAVEKLGGPAVAIDHELVRRKVSVDVKGKTRAEALALLAKAAGGVVRGNRIIPLWQAAAHKALEKKIKDLELRKGDLTLGGFVQYVRSVTGVTVALDPRLSPDLGVTGKVNDVAVRRALDTFLTPLGCKWDLRYGSVFIAKPERLLALPVALPDVPQPQLRFGIRFEKTALPMMRSYFVAATGVRYEPLPPAAETEEVTAVGSNLRHDQALALVLYPIGWSARTKKGAVEIYKPK